MKKRTRQFPVTKTNGMPKIVILPKPGIGAGIANGQNPSSLGREFSYVRKNFTEAFKVRHVRQHDRYASEQRAGKDQRKES